MHRLINFAGPLLALTAMAMVSVQELTGKRLEPYILTVSLFGLLLYFVLRFAFPARNVSKR